VNLQDSTEVSAGAEGLRASIDPEWMIWGPVGGYLASIALRAAGLHAEGHRPVSFSCQFLARGKAGLVNIEHDIVKPGSTQFCRVSISQEGVALLQAQICTTSKTDGPDKVDVKATEVPLPDALEPFADQLARYGHQAIPFWRNVEGRQVDFRAPGDPDPRGGRTERWLRFKDWVETDDPFLDASRALIGIDTHLWAAYNRGLSELPRHIAPSLDLTVWFHDAAPDSAWQLTEARADFARHALLGGSARIWSEDGRLVASGGGQCLFVQLRTE
jgi:acyl-CoA thioesterase II